MTLQETLETMEKDDLVKIGTQVGSGWMYAGTVGGFANEEGRLTTKAAKDTQTAQKEAVKRLARAVGEYPTRESWRKGGNGMEYEEFVSRYGRAVDNAAKAVARAIRAKKEIKRFYDREVIETYEAQLEKATNIIVEGSGDGETKEDERVYTCTPVPPLTVDDMDDDVARRLLGAIYRADTAALKRAYKARLKLKKGFTIEQRRKLAEKEKEIENNIYGMFSDDEEAKAFLRECRFAARRELKEEAESKGAGK